MIDSWNPFEFSEAFIVVASLAAGSAVIGTVIHFILPKISRPIKWAVFALLIFGGFMYPYIPKETQYEFDKSFADWRVFGSRDSNGSGNAACLFTLTQNEETLEYFGIVGDKYSGNLHLIKRDFGQHVNKLLGVVDWSHLRDQGDEYVIYIDTPLGREMILGEADNLNNDRNALRLRLDEHPTRKEAEILSLNRPSEFISKHLSKIFVHPNFSYRTFDYHTLEVSDSVPFSTTGVSIALDYLEECREYFKEQTP